MFSGILVRSIRWIPPRTFEVTHRACTPYRGREYGSLYWFSQVDPPRRAVSNSCACTNGRRDARLSTRVGARSTTARDLPGEPLSSTAGGGAVRCVAGARGARNELHRTTSAAPKAALVRGHRSGTVGDANRWRRWDRQLSAGARASRGPAPAPPFSGNERFPCPAAGKREPRAPCYRMWQASASPRTRRSARPDRPGAGPSVSARVLARGSLRVRPAPALLRGSRSYACRHANVEGLVRMPDLSFPESTRVAATRSRTHAPAFPAPHTPVALPARSAGPARTASGRCCSMPLRDCGGHGANPRRRPETPRHPLPAKRADPRRPTRLSAGFPGRRAKRRHHSVPVRATPSEVPGTRVRRLAARSAEPIPQVRWTTECVGVREMAERACEGGSGPTPAEAAAPRSGPRPRGWQAEAGCAPECSRHDAPCAINGTAPASSAAGAMSRDEALCGSD